MGADELPKLNMVLGAMLDPAPACVPEENGLVKELLVLLGADPDADDPAPKLKSKLLPAEIVEPAPKMPPEVPLLAEGMEADPNMLVEGAV